jgi:hypothetical protein
MARNLRGNFVIGWPASGRIHPEGQFRFPNEKLEEEQRSSIAPMIRHSFRQELWPGLCGFGLRFLSLARASSH